MHFCSGVDNQIILDLDATDDPVHGEQEGRFFQAVRLLLLSAALRVLRARSVGCRLRRANIDAAAGSVEEVARIVAQIRRRWPVCAHSAARQLRLRA